MTTASRKSGGRARTASLTSSSSSSSSSSTSSVGLAILNSGSGACSVEVSRPLSSTNVGRRARLRYSLMNVLRRIVSSQALMYVPFSNRVWNRRALTTVFWVRSWASVVFRVSRRATAYSISRCSRTSFSNSGERLSGCSSSMMFWMVCISTCHCFLE